MSALKKAYNKFSKEEETRPLIQSSTNSTTWTELEELRCILHPPKLGEKLISCSCDEFYMTRVKYAYKDIYDED